MLKSESPRFNLGLKNSGLEIEFVYSSPTRLLDEVSMGLAPIVVSELFEVIGNIALEGIAIIVVEQFVKAALSLASRAAVMIQGEVVFSGAPDEAGAAAADMYLRMSDADGSNAGAGRSAKES